MHMSSLLFWGKFKCDCLLICLRCILYFFNFLGWSISDADLYLTCLKYLTVKSIQIDQNIKIFDLVECVYNNYTIKRIRN